jgi:hypothetical protein
MHAIVRGRSPLRTVLYLADEWVLFVACLLACLRWSSWAGRRTIPRAFCARLEADWNVRRVVACRASDCEVLGDALQSVHSREKAYYHACVCGMKTCFHWYHTLDDLAMLALLYASVAENCHVSS